MLLSKNLNENSTCCVEKFVKFLRKHWTKWSFWKSLACRLKNKIMSTFKLKQSQNPSYQVQISAFSQFGSAYTCFVIILYNLQIYKEEHSWTTIAVGLIVILLKIATIAGNISLRHFCQVSDTHFLAKINDINSHFIKTFYIVKHKFNYFLIISHLCVIQVGRYTQKR